MTPRDKLLALLAKAEGLEARATKAPWKLERGNVGAQHPLFITVLWFDGVRFPNEADTEYAALSRNSFLPVLRLLVERLDECNACKGRGVARVWKDGCDGPEDGDCPSCIPCYAALCAELEKLEVIGL